MLKEKEKTDAQDGFKTTTTMCKGSQTLLSYHTCGATLLVI